MKFVKNPFIPITIFFVTGIAIGYYLNIHFSYSIFFILFTPILFYFLERQYFRNKPLNYSLFALPFFLIFGIFVVSFKTPVIDKKNTTDNLIYSAIVIQPPKQKPKSTQIIIKIKSFKDSTSWQKLNTKAILYVQKDSSTPILNYGDLVIFKGKLQQINNAGNPNEFDYRKFMQNKGIFFTSYIKSNHIKILAHHKGNPAVDMALRIRQHFLDIYKKYKIEGRDFGVLSALTLGYRDEVDLQTRQMFANTGAMHILAVSGLHVGIIYIILVSLLAFMDKKKKLKYVKPIIIIASLWLFATIAGLSPSVTRSALMFTLFVIGKILMRNTTIYNVIFASAFILLLINPLNLFNVGFQLSYAAVLSIVFFQPYIYKLFSFKKVFFDKLWALTSVSIAAQIGTMPIGLYYFHQFPNYFFFTNIIVIPLASLILYTAVLLLIVSPIPFIAKFIAFVLKLWLKILLFSIEFIDKLPFATTKNIFITSPELIILFIVILSLPLWFIYKKKILAWSFLASLTIFLFIDILFNFKNNSENTITFFNTRGYSTFQIKSDTNYIFSEDALFAKRKRLQYAILPYFQSQRITKLPVKEFIIDSITKKDTTNKIWTFKHNFFKIGNLSFIYLRNDKIFDFTPKSKLKVDYIILAHNIYINIQDLKKYFEFKKIIIDPSNKNYRYEKWEKQCSEDSLSFHNINTQGAISINYIDGKEKLY